MQKVIKNKWVQYYIPFTLILFLFLTLERSVETDGGYDKLFGFPFSYISNNIGYSFHYHVFIGKLFIDFFINLIFIIVLFKAIEKFVFPLKTHLILSIASLLFSLFMLSTFYLMILESSFFLFKDGIPTEITKYKIHFGFYPS